MIGSKVKIQNDQVIKVSKMKPVIKPTVPHKHAGYHELIFLSKGAGSHNIGSAIFKVAPPIAFYIRPGQVHAWSFSQIPEGFVILFKEEALSLYSRSRDNLFNLPPKFDLPEDPDFLLMVKQFCKEHEAVQTQEILEAYLNLILLKCFEISDDNPSADSSMIADFYKFKLLVNKNFIQHRQVMDYADLMNMSVYKLNKICMSVAKIRAINVIKERLLTEAQNLIIHTNHNISEIAYSLNFDDPSNFVKFFKSLMALTPSQYRARRNSNKI